MNSIPAEDGAWQQNYDSEFCGSIPLNFINLIQPHGVLLVLDKKSFRIVQVSENSQSALALSPDRVAGQLLADFIGDEQVVKLQDKIKQAEVKKHLQLSLTWKTPEQEKQFSAIVHLKELKLLLELEEIKEIRDSASFMAIYQGINLIVSALKEAGSLQEVAVNRLKKLSGFDRLMIYKFDESWNGTVVAEALEAGMDPYLNLRFPASDVPKQARELYFHTPYRLIPDVNAENVKLYPVVNPLTSSLTDISDCVLRGVPLVHVEYLNNMGVAASMSTPIIVNNQLWGLISCHHRQPKEISFELRSSFEIVSGIIASQIGVREKEDSFQYRSALHKIELKLAEQLYGSLDLEEALLSNPSFLLDLLEAEGVAIMLENRYESVGEVPEQKMVRNLVKYLSRFKREKVFSTDTLPRVFREAVNYKEVASGLIALQITPGRQYILGFRPEVVHSVNWGGNPNQAIQVEEDGKRYHPRNSFKLWKEQVEFTSEPWTPEVLEAAENVRTAILEKIIRESEDV